MQGRESEWLFSSEEGQRQVAMQCRCRRVILVAMNRHHKFASQAAVQTELSPLVKPLAPLDVRDTPQAIPIMTTQQGVGRRRVLAARASSSGQIIVEDVAVDDGTDITYARRMVFADNSSLIQSEARLGVSMAQAADTKAKAGRNKKSASKNADSQGQEFPQLELDLSVLPMEYHKQVVAGIIASDSLNTARENSEAAVLVIGLGGGGLPVFLSNHLQLNTTAIELSPEVKELASEFFGCTETSRLQIKIQDGLEAVAEAQEASLDVIVLDAGSNNAMQAISCPPAPFLQPAFLQNAASCLKPKGLLVVNCVTRSDAAFQQATQSIKAVFKHVSVSEVEEDVNRVLFAAKHVNVLPRGPPVKGNANAALLQQKHPDESKYGWLLKEMSDLILTAV